MADEITLEKTLAELFEATARVVTLRADLAQTERKVQDRERSAILIAMEAGVFGKKPELDNSGIFKCGEKNYRCDKQAKPKFTVLVDSDRIIEII